MIFESLSQAQGVETFARSLAHSLWQGVLLAALLALTLRFISSRRSRLRYGLALTVLAGFLLLPALNFALTLRQGAQTHTGQPAGAAVQPQVEPVQLSLPFSAFLSLNTRLELPWESLGVALYLLSVVLLAGRVGMQLLYVRRLRRTTVPVGETLRTRLQKLASLAGSTRVPQLGFSSRVDTAMVMGWRQPLILLPSGIETRLTPGQLDSVLLHELAHVRTYDYAVNVFQLLTEALFFFHPALWWVSGVVRQEREYRCDDLAAQACGDRQGYAEALLALEKVRSRPSSAIALAGTSGNIVTRVRRLFGCPVPRARVGKLVVQLAITSIFGVSAGFSQQHDLLTPSSLAPAPQAAVQPKEARVPPQGVEERMPAIELNIVPSALPVEPPHGVEPSVVPSAVPVEPSQAGCAALGGRWFHIRVLSFTVIPEMYGPDTQRSIPLRPNPFAEPPDIESSIQIPAVEYRGRCAIQRPHK